MTECPTCCELQQEVVDVAGELACDNSDVSEYFSAAALIKLLCQSFIVYDAWTPVIGIEQQGNDLAFLVNDWFGGSGTKPDSPKYIGPDGLVDTFAEAEQINLSVSITGAGSFIGEYTAGVDLSSNRFVHISGDDTIIYADSSLGLEAHGLIVAPALTGNQVDVFNGGLFGGFAGMTGGEARYLSVTGLSSGSPPATTGHISQQVAVAKNATNLFVDIEETTLIP